MAIFRNGYIAPVAPNGKQGLARGKGGDQATGLEGEARRIVDNAELLTEVIRRACFLYPGLVREMLEATDERGTAILIGGYVERFGRNHTVVFEGGK